MENEATGILQPGNFVVVTAPGRWFGKVGEVIERALTEGCDWWVEFTMDHRGAPFSAQEVLRVR